MASNFVVKNHQYASTTGSVSLWVNQDNGVHPVSIIRNYLYKFVKCNRLYLLHTTKIKMFSLDTAVECDFFVFHLYYGLFSIVG